MPPKLKIRLQMNLLGIDQMVMAVLVALIGQRLHRVEVEWEVVHQDPPTSTDWGVWNEIMFHIPGAPFVGSDLHQALDLAGVQNRFVSPRLMDLFAGSSAQIRRVLEHNFADIKNLNQTLYSTVYLVGGELDSPEYREWRASVSTFIEMVTALIEARIPELQQAG